jgi:hypothetical protein
VQTHGVARSGAPRARSEAAHALQHGRAGDGRLRKRARSAARGVRGRARATRLRRRDAPASPGKQADRVGARPARHPEYGGRRLGRGSAHVTRGSDLRRGRGRSDRRQRRHREQDRHVLARGPRGAPCDSALRGRADLVDRPRDVDRERDPDRGA